MNDQGAKASKTKMAKSLSRGFPLPKMLPVYISFGVNCMFQSNAC